MRRPAFFSAIPLALLALLAARAAKADAPIAAKPEIVPARTEPAKADAAKPPAIPDAELKFEPKPLDAKVTLAMEDADLSDLVRTIQQMTGRRFVLAATKTKSIKATIYAPEKVTVAEAYQAFLAVLQANGLTVLPSGAFWKIVDSQDAAKQSTPIDPLTGEERYVTRVLRMHNVSAEEVAANVLTKFTTRDASVVPYAPGNLVILTDTGENIRRMERILEDVDVAAPGDKVWLEPLHYVSASDVQKKLGEVFGMKADAKSAVSNPQDHLTRMVALDRPNALVVVGTEPAYKRVLAFLERLDVPVATEGAIHVVPLQYADAKKIVPAISEAINGANGAGAKPGTEPVAILDAAVKVSAEETTNAVLVTSTEHDFAAVRDVIAKLDKPRRQVYIEAVVMDLSLVRGKGLGVQYHGADASGDGTIAYGGMNPFASVGAPAGQLAAAGSDQQLQALALGVRGPSVNVLGMSLPSFGAFIQASQQDNDSDILQTPHILATDNVPAEIRVQLHRSLQQNYPSYSSLTTGSSSGATAAAALNPYALGTAPASSNYQAIGPKIQVTPHLNESDDVRLDVEETISDTDGVPQGTLGTISFTERAAKTTLTVRDQQTVVIGGLVADKATHREVKVPLLGDIPVIGALFRSTQSGQERGDLVLVLTPYIVRDQEDMRRIVERRMEERQELLEHEAVFSDRPWSPPRTYARARGLLTRIRKDARALDEERKLAEQLAPRPVLGHEGTAPIDLPAMAAPAANGPSPAPKPTDDRSPKPDAPMRLER